MNQAEINFLCRWARALNSDMYQQTRGTLCNNKEYCCLGVALKIQGVADEDLWGHATLDYEDPSNGGPFASPATSTTKKVFRKTHDLVESSGLTESDYIDMNDDERLPFKYIAKTIMTQVNEAIAASVRHRRYIADLDKAIDKFHNRSVFD